MAEMTRAPSSFSLSIRRSGDLRLEVRNLLFMSYKSRSGVKSKAITEEQVYSSIVVRCCLDGEKSRGIKHGGACPDQHGDRR